ncbi:MAG: hypothetical protein HGGPFJEG_02596 [Ignavibacteria bacterium]|nr:hypothetical protein [Ignavibacteria bacterium]
MTVEEINTGEKGKESDNTEENLNNDMITSDIKKMENISSEDLTDGNENNESDAALTGTDETGDTKQKFLEYFEKPAESMIPKMTSTLKIFLELKNVDEELADIAEAKGNLPEAINSLEQKIKSYTEELAVAKETTSIFDKESSKLKADNDSYEEKINKYDEQKYNVKSNKEYDEIVKSIDSMFDEVSKNEKLIKDITAKSEELNSRISVLEAKAKELTDELEEKKSTLKELDEEYKIEETALTEKRRELSEGLDEQNLNLYNKVNSKHKGEATAIVRKGNCSGCFNSIPPQRVIEIKTAEKIFTCQSCGRILISEELANS